MELEAGEAQSTGQAHLAAVASGSEGSPALQGLGAARAMACEEGEVWGPHRQAGLGQPRGQKKGRPRGQHQGKPVHMTPLTPEKKKRSSQRESERENARRACKGPVREQDYLALGSRACRRWSSRQPLDRQRQLPRE